MPTFTKSAVVAIREFTITVVISEPGPEAQMGFSLNLVDAGGHTLDSLGGNLRPFLTAQQQTNFENAVLALYAKAQTELLS